MALFDAAMQAGGDAIAALLDYGQLHSASPGVAGTSNVTSAGRQALSWNAASSNGDFDLASTVNFTGGAASGACTHISFWSASSSGTCYGWVALTGDQTFNAAGAYSVTEIAFDGSTS